MRLTNRKIQIERERAKALGTLFGSLLFARFFGDTTEEAVRDEWNRKYLPNGDRRDTMSTWVLGA